VRLFESRGVLKDLISLEGFDAVQNR